MVYTQIASDVLTVTAPVYVAVFIGILLKRLSMLSDQFLSGASNLVYKGTMPVLLFLALKDADLRTELNFKLMGYYLVCGLTTIVIGSIIASRSLEQRHKAVFVQGIFRGNHGIIALALAVNLFGSEGLTLASTMVALAAVANNALSPLIFAFFDPQLRLSPRKIVHEVLLSPMIIGVFLGIIASLVGLWMPAGIEAGLKQFASISLPLALICIGASLSLESIRSSGWLTLHTTLGKLVWVPLIYVPLGYFALDLTAIEVGMLFVFLAVPTAAVSYILAEVAGGDSVVAANIVVLTTALSMITISAGLFMLTALQWM